MKQANERAARTGRARAATIFGIAFAWVAAACAGGAIAEPAAAPQSVDDFYVARGKRVDLTLDIDRTGVVLRARGAREKVFDDLRAKGARYVTTHRDLVHVFDPEGEPGPAELTQVGLELTEEEDVLHAGVLGTPKGAEQPILITHEIVVRFRREVRDEDVQRELEGLDLRLVERSAFVDNLFLVALRSRTQPGVQPGARSHTLEVVRALNRSPLVDYAEPNAVHHIEHLGEHPNDPYFPTQWHLDNDGTDGAIDADIDAPEAWELTKGGPDVVIAVFEDGFDTGHPDLAPNLWIDPETGAVGKSFTDDPAVEGDPGDHHAAAHGTAVAGCAGARADNGIGVAGSCPECSLMLVRRSLHPWGDAQAIGWAEANGAAILSNSWTYAASTTVPLVVSDMIAQVATSGRGGKGCLVLFGVRNVQTEVDLSTDIPTLEHVMAIGSIANTDERVMRCGYGTCLSVLGPSRYNRSSSNATGTRNVSTTDWRDAEHGYNADEELAVEMTEGFPPCGDHTDTGDYTLCFGGTSAATPIVAGVAGLVLSADPELEAIQVRRLLQDTADRASPTAAVYGPENGVSSSLLYGNGRVNAFEAVRVVAPTANGGRGGVDVFVRDNALDWGNTEQPSTMLFEPVRGTISAFESVDIKIDAAPWSGTVTDAASFATFADEDPVGGANRVHVRVRNRGPDAAKDVKVALFVADGASAPPPLPDGFWAAFDAAEPGDGPTVVGGAGAASLAEAWFLAGVVEVASLAYCGPSVAWVEGATGPIEDAAAIATFEIAVPELAGPARDIALLVLVDCAADPLSEASRATTSPAELVPNDNNATLRLVTLKPSPAPR